GSDRDVAQSLVNAVDPGVERVETRGDAVELRAETIDALTKCSNRGQYRAVVGSIGFQGRDPCFEITKRSHELSLSSPTDLVERQRWAYPHLDHDLRCSIAWFQSNNTCAAG
ncbi:MAG: hypothetical protein QOI39_2693, partial [Mycobacterium sp.]|nr:hypothetical protein [Mycobacterium sp.]